MASANTDKSTYRPPCIIVLIDVMDALLQADIFDEEKYQIFDQINDFNKAKVVADALYILKNYKWNSFEEMTNVDGGWDVRVYDSNNSCIYIAHQTFGKTWIGYNIK